MLAVVWGDMPGTQFPPALPHGELEEIFDDVFFVSGSVKMPGPVPMIFSRNMVVLREGDQLVIVHSMRLGEDGLRKLDALGNVTDVIRLAGFHGMDDPFYADRYGARVHAVEGQVYASASTTRRTARKPTSSRRRSFRRARIFRSPTRHSSRSTAAHPRASSFWSETVGSSSPVTRCKTGRPRTSSLVSAPRSS